jgi:hypothetical protein
MLKVSLTPRYCDRCSNVFQPGGNRQKYCKDCNSNRNANRAIQNRFDATTEFIGVDGEGTGDGSDHRYVLLGCGIQHVASDAGLSTDAIFTFLWDCFQENPKAAYVGFFLSYDFTQWLKGLPFERAIMLYTEWGRAARTPRQGSNRHILFPVRWGDWEFDLLGDKRFKLRRKGHAEWMYICDAGPFFQCSLLKAIDPEKWPEPICSQAEYDTILEGKSLRDVAVLGPDMIRYNSLENDILARLMHRIEVGFVAQGVQLKRSQWFGPGQAASAWLKNLGTVPKSAELDMFIPREVLTDIGRFTYYGGWFEIMAHGHIPGVTYEYDINSAYPWVIANLPCLEHGEWSRGHMCEPPQGEYTICHVILSGSDPRTGPVPHRNAGGEIARHQNVSGWYWLSELDAARAAGLIDTISYLDWYSYKACSCKPPLARMAELYQHRLDVGKDTPEGKADKLLYNSAYGKFAQSIANGGPWGNPIYASLITSGCRTKILEAIATHPHKTRDLVMVATDAVYFITPHPSLPISDKLGDWSSEKHDNLCLFKPGVYWSDKARDKIREGKAPSFKARGFSAAAFGATIAQIDEHYNQWGDTYPPDRDPSGPREGWHPRVNFTTAFSMVTARQAVNRHNWDTAGLVTADAEMWQDADPIIKRGAGVKDRGIYWSKPHAGWTDTESVPYDKRFGQIFDPDDAGFGVSDDGYTRDVLRGMMDLDI